MKKARNTALICCVCLLSALNLSAQIKKEGAKKQPNTPVLQADTTKPTPTNTQPPTKANTQQIEDDLLESIQRDIKQNPNTPTEPNVQERQPVLERAVERAPKPPKVRKPHAVYTHELQLEGGAFLNQLFRVFGLVKEGEPYNASPYFAAYKYKLSKKSDEGGAIRLGLGGFFDRQEETVGGFADKKQTDTTAFSGRLGFEFQRNIGDDFKWTFGADVVLQNNQKRLYADSGADQYTDKTVGWSKGFGFLMGIRWDFTDRASIGSEMNLQFLNFKGEQNQTFTANPQFDKKVRTINNTRTSFLGPSNIYISWRF